MSIIRLGTYKLIDDALTKRAQEEPRRSYLGASMLGTECDRQLWYEFHTPVTIDDPRINRIFDLGNRIEDLVIDWLKLSGLEVLTRDENGEQFGFVDEMIAGHADGAVRGLPESSKWHLLEIKSAKSSSFKEYQEKGVAAVNAKYFYQMQTYMLKLGLEYALFIVMNKDTCELYIERVELNKNLAKNAILRAKEIAVATELPDRKWNKSSHYKCRFCSFNKQCWGL